MSFNIKTTISPIRKIPTEPMTHYEYFYGDYEIEKNNYTNVFKPAYA